MPVEMDEHATLPEAMTDLEERLRSPGGSVLKAEVIARLSALESTVDLAIRNGLPPPEFAKAGPVLEGIQAARHLISQFPTIET